MGRPIKSKYFLKSGPQAPGVAVTYAGVTVSINANGTHYSSGATATFSAPNDTGGQQASLTLTVNTSTGAISAATIANIGSGYNVAPSVTVNKPASVTLSATLSTTTNVISGITTTGIYVGMKMDGAPGMPANNYVRVVTASAVHGTYNFTSNTTTNVSFSDQGSGATFTVGLTNTENDTGIIGCTAYIPVVNGGSSAVASTIIKQEGSRSYLVENNQGHGRCHLTAGSVTAGLMTIIAQDANGSQYFVTKLTAHKVRLSHKSMVGSYVYAEGAVAKWALGVASAYGTNPTLSTTKVGIVTY